MKMSNRRWDSWIPDSDVTPMYRKIPKSTANGIRRSTDPMTMDRPGGGDTDLPDPSNSPVRMGRPGGEGDLDHLTDELGLITTRRVEMEKMERDREPEKGSWKVKKQVWGAGQGPDRLNLEIQKRTGPSLE